MTRSTKTGALKTLAVASIAMLGLAACGNDSTPDADAPADDTSATAAEVETDAPAENDDAGSEPKDLAAYEAALTGLTYHGEPLELGDSASLEAMAEMADGMSDEEIEYTVSPAECEAYLEGTEGVGGSEEVDLSTAAYATAHVEDEYVSAHIWPGGARVFDFDSARQLPEKCSSLEMSAEFGTLTMEFQALPVEVSGSDDSAGFVTSAAMEGMDAEHQAVMYAGVGDDLIMVSVDSADGDQAELQAMIQQIADALK